MGVIRPKNSPYYRWQCMIGGHRYGGSTKRKTEREALAYFYRQRARIIKEIEEGPVNKKPRLTLDQAAQKFFELKAQFRTDAQDIDLYLERLLTGLGPHTYVDEINDQDLLALQSKLRGEKTRYGTYPSNRTVNATVPYTARLLWRFCKKTLKCEIGEEPAWEDLTLPEPQERVRELSRDEEQRLFQHLRADYHPLMRFAFLSGLRLSNLMRLTWTNIDWEQQVVTVKGKSRKEGGKRLNVPITGPMLAILQGCKGQHPIYVFTWICKRVSKSRKKGQRYPFKKSTFRRPFKAALKAADIEDFRFHDYRHTAATRVLRASKSLKAVQLMLGHDDITTTAKYAHVMMDDVRAAMDAVDYTNFTQVGENEESAKDVSSLNKRRKSK